MSEKLKIRVPNFTPSEKLHLMRLIANQFATILEDKKTDRASAEKKDKAWLEITSIFNATSSSSIPRTTASLKKCYENRKKELRKTLAEERRDTLLTGGGPSNKKIKTDESDEVLLSIMNKKTLIGLPNQFDDDADDSPLTVQETNSQNEIEFILDNECTERFESDILGTENIQSPLDIPSTSQSSAVMTDWKKYNGEKLQAPINTSLVNKFFENYKREDKEVMSVPDSVPTPKSRRRPTTVVKSLTSSDVAKKYDILLDKRLALVEKQLKHMDEEHALNMQKKQLEIEILKAELRSKQK